MFSLERFKVLLGKTKLMGPKPPFHAQESFHGIVFESLVLSACMEELKCKDLDALRERMKTCNFNKVIKKLSREYFDLKRVARDRDQRLRDNIVREGGTQRGRGRGGGLRGPRRGGRSRGRGRGRAAEALANEDEVGEAIEGEDIPVTMHDQVRENATLCIQHLAISRLFHDAIRGGDTGVIEGMLDILTLFFHGTNNSKYAAEFLLQNINRKVLWTPFYREVWLDNCVVNITGRPGCWMSLDEVCEITVDQLKNDYNPRGSWQSRHYHLNVVSPNIHLLRVIKERVMRSACASTGGLKKGIVSISKDVSVLCKILIEDGVFIQTPGRVGMERVEGVMEYRKYKEASDALEIGIMRLRDKDLPFLLEKIRMKQSLFIENGEESEGVEDLDLLDITGGVEISAGSELLM